MKSLISSILFVLAFTNCMISQPAISIQGRNILVNGTNYYIRGVCYNPVAIGDDRFDPLDFSYINQDTQLMAQAEINTVRTYVPILDDNVLDKFANAGIKVIIGFPNYDDTFRYPDINSGNYLNYINAHKNHEAILMWELGNEYNYHPEWFNNDIKNWYTILNNAAAAIHNADPNHPVSTAHGEVPASDVIAACPNVDVWGMNVYRWDDPSAAITEFALRSSKPCYLSESGADRFNNTEGHENQQQQADADIAIWNRTKINLDKCSGITFFSFVDEWWKSGNVGIHDASGFSMSVPYDNFANEEWWGIVDINRNVTLAYNTLKVAFSGFTGGIENSRIQKGSLLFPNPAENRVNIKLSEPISEDLVLTISTITGNEVVSSPVQVSGREIEVSLYKFRLPVGIYIISAVGKTVRTRNLLIKN
ncbi:MAG: T9SS type A sorting domain-containing protein [Bacteroidales bacterium]|nr:T9SS type A sorting domain-containing protein [Bacteroidales bacterium]